MLRERTFQDRLRDAAKSVLTDYAQDLHRWNMPELTALRQAWWDEVRRWEARFYLRGFTICLVCRYDDEAKAVTALRCLSKTRFELDELDRIQIECANDALRDFERVRGRDALARIRKQLNY